MNTNTDKIAVLWLYSLFSISTAGILIFAAMWVHQVTRIADGTAVATLSTQVRVYDYNALYTLPKRREWSTPQWKTEFRDNLVELAR